MKPRRAAKKAPARKRIKLGLVEISISGSDMHPGLMAQTLSHCFGLASEGKSANITAPGITATVKVTR